MKIEFGKIMDMMLLAKLKENPEENGMILELVNLGREHGLSPSETISFLMGVMSIGSKHQQEDAEGDA